MEKPNSTGVLDLLAERKKTTVQNIVLDFLEFPYEFKELATTKKIEKTDFLNERYFAVKLKDKYKCPNASLYHIHIPGKSKLVEKYGSEYNFSSLEVLVNDFDFFVIEYDSHEQFYTMDYRTNEADEWRKELIKFDKQFLFKEFSNIKKFEFNTEIRKFGKMMSSLSQEIEKDQ